MNHDLGTAADQTAVCSEVRQRGCAEGLSMHPGAEARLILLLQVVIHGHGRIHVTIDTVNDQLELLATGCRCHNVCLEPGQVCFMAADLTGHSDADDAAVSLAFEWHG